MVTGYKPLNYYSVTVKLILTNKKKQQIMPVRATTRRDRYSLL